MTVTTTATNGASSTVEYYGGNGATSTAIWNGGSYQNLIVDANLNVLGSDVVVGGALSTNFDLTADSLSVTCISTL